MSKIIIGIDPDSKAHGVAVYVDGKLDKLDCSDLVGIVGFIKVSRAIESIEFHIEDVCANNFVYARNNKGNKSVTSKIAMSIGRCQQSQTELMRMLDYYKVKYVLHKPQKGNWAKNKAQFEKVTGWTGRSNEDTRSAAYFGWLGTKS